MLLKFKLIWFSLHNYKLSYIVKNLKKIFDESMIKIILMSILIKKLVSINNYEIKIR